MQTIETSVFSLSREQLDRLCQDISREVTRLQYEGHMLRVYLVKVGFALPEWTYGSHSHPFYEAHIVLSGAISYTTTETTSLIGPGSVLLHEIGTVHNWQVVAGGFQCLGIHFDVEPRIPVQVNGPWPVWPDMLWEVALLLEDARRQQIGWQTRARWRMGIVLSRLLTLAEWKKDSLVASRLTDDPIATLDTFLQENLHRQLTLDDVAAHIGVSKRSLVRYVRQWVGETVMQRLQRYRMGRATELLSFSRLSLKEIADAIGIPDVSYFSACYCRYHHLTPSQFRRQFEKTETGYVLPCETR